MDREQDIHFVYENGVLRPEERVNLPEGAREGEGGHLVTVRWRETR